MSRCGRALRTGFKADADATSAGVGERPEQVFAVAHDEIGMGKSAPRAVAMHRHALGERAGLAWIQQTDIVEEHHRIVFTPEGAMGGGHGREIVVDRRARKVARAFTPPPHRNDS